MNMHLKSTAPDDEELQELDLSQSGRNKHETVELDGATAVMFGDIESDDEPDTDASQTGAVAHLADDVDPIKLVATEWANRDPDLRNISPAEAMQLAELERVLSPETQVEDSPTGDDNSLSENKLTAMPAAAAEVQESTPDVRLPTQQTLITGLPEGFSLHADGVYVVVDSDEADEDLEEQLLCSPLRVIDLFRERDGSAWGRRIVVTSPEGRETTVAVLNEVLEARGRNFLSQLAGLGLRFGKVKKARETVLDLLTTWNPDKLMLSTNRQGWADDACEAFVLGGGLVVGDPDVVSVNSNLSTVADAICGHGTLENWKSNVASLCIGNTLMTTAVSLAFVGPLLELLGRDGGGLHLRGKSSRGKTTLQRSAASVWGSPKVVQSWRTTSNALEATAAAANGMLLVLDELGEVNGQALNEAAYMLANGTGKARLGGFGMTSSTRKWKLALLSSGEIGINEKIAESGRRVKAGQEVRLIDVVADSQLHGAFDALHGCADGAAFARLVGEKSSLCYGTAGPAFVQWLLDNKPKLKVLVETATDVFQKLVDGHYSPPKDGVTTRTISWFALVAVAGHLATEAGLTGWPRHSAITSVVATFGEWLDARMPDDLTATTSAVARVRAFLEVNENLFVVIVKSGETAFSSTGWKDDNFYYIPSTTWKLMHNGIDTKVAARELEVAGLLVGGEDGNRMRKNRFRYLEDLGPTPSRSRSSLKWPVAFWPHRSLAVRQQPDDCIKTRTIRASIQVGPDCPHRPESPGNTIGACG